MIRIPFTNRYLMLLFWPKASFRYDENGKVYMILREA